MKRPLDELAEIAQQAVAIGSNLIKNTRPQTVTEKSDRDTYTDVDLRIERQIRSYLTEATPEIDILGEEEGGPDRITDSEYFWTVDPIDGTANFVHEIPLCAVQIALIHDSNAIAAAVSLPYMSMNYSAASGLGSYLNARRIAARPTKKLSDAIVSIGDYATGLGAERKNHRRIALTTALAARVQRVRMFGSAAHDLAWLADGRIDAAVILSNNLWDIAAGTLIAREAGAQVFDASGKQHDQTSVDTIATVSGIAEELLSLIPE